MSDLTLAFLEDTGQYLAAYDKAGALLDVEAVEFSDVSSFWTAGVGRD